MDNKAKKYISVDYALHSIDEQGIHLEEKTTADRPFIFLSGFGLALPAFEERIVSLGEGDDFDFKLTPTEGFGEYDENQIQTLEREVFSINGHFDHEHIYEGAAVPMQDADGHHFYVTIKSITEDHVVVDHNHPLAGKTLHFHGHVNESREATNEEIQRIISIMSGEGCGCGCGCDDHDCHHDHEGGCGCGHCH